MYWLIYNREGNPLKEFLEWLALYLGNTEWAKRRNKKQIDRFLKEYGNYKRYKAT